MGYTTGKGWASNQPREEDVKVIAEEVPQEESKRGGVFGFLQRRKNKKEAAK